MPNTPAFLESIFGIVAGGAVIVPVNYRLKDDDISYILDFAEVDLVLVDWEFEGLLAAFKTLRPGVKIVVDTVSVYLCVPVRHLTSSSLVTSGHRRHRGGAVWPL